MSKPKSVKRICGIISELRYEDLVEIVRGKGIRKSKESAYNEIELRIKFKILYIVRKFYIPGCNHDDILQEALYALRFKAIPDYDKTKGRGGEAYPFDKFAILCIRRHLSTLLKSSFQNKRKALNTSLSLDQDRGSNEDENIYLSDILPKTNFDLVSILGEKEYYSNLFNTLYSKLSELERYVYLLYIKKYSYDEMTAKINKEYKKKGYKKRYNIKSIDNSISRIKAKAKAIYKKHKDS
jgi:RNA polymerase sporulation-specific sigma factor